MFIQANESSAGKRQDEILFVRLDDKSFATWILDVNTGQTTRLTSNRYHARNWSPDGTQILASYSDGNPFGALSLVVMEADGKNPQHLTNPDLINSSDGIWSPDGNTIFFSAFDKQTEKGQPSWAIYSVPAKGGSIHRLIEPSTSRSGLALSPDGSTIVFNKDAKYYTMSTDAKDIHVIDVPLHANSQIAWSPDGSQIAVITSDQYKENFGIYLFEPYGSNMRLLVTDMVRSIEWSSDSSELLFWASPNFGITSALGIVNVNTGKIDKYEVGHGVLESINGIRKAVWSADGTQIVITGKFKENNPYDSSASLYLVDRHFTQIRRLTHVHNTDDVVQWRPQISEFSN